MTVINIREQTVNKTYPGPVLPARPDRWLEFAFTMQFTHYIK